MTALEVYNRHTLSARYDAGVAQIRAGQIRAFYLSDITETIDLQSLPALVGG